MESTDAFFKEKNMEKILVYHFLDHLKALPFVEEIYLYGSRARGDNGRRSDIDLAVSCPGATDEEWGKVLEIIENADTLLEIDCVRLDTLGNHDRLKQNIVSQGKVLYRRSGQ
jgi:predicted nucleotidyltransferase